MPNKATAGIGNELLDMLVYIPAVPVPNVPSQSSASNTWTLPGVQVGDMIGWNWLGNVANLAIDNLFVSAPNTVTGSWSNATLAAINATPAQPFLLEIVRSDATMAFGDLRLNLPNAVV